MSGSTITLNLNKQERKDLEEQIRKTHERKMADRLRVILYRAEGYTIQSIANSCKWVAIMSPRSCGATVTAGGPRCCARTITKAPNPS